MTGDIALTLGIIVLAVFLFATEKLRVDVVALLVLVVVGVTGLIDRDRVFDGFASPAVITVWAVYIVSYGLLKTGVADAIGRVILRLAGNTESRLVAVIMVTCGSLSAFMNNVGATAMLLPTVVEISRKTKIPVSKLLLPLSFSSLMGGKMTLIGTPANILAAGILVERGLPSFGFFDFLPIGLVVLTTGVIYMVLLGRHLIPVRRPLGDVNTDYGLREYVSEVSVSPTSRLVGRSLAQSRLGADYDLTVMAVVRESGESPMVQPELEIEAGDLLMVKGGGQPLVRAQRDLELITEPELTVPLDDEGDICIVEATLAPASRSVDRTLNEVRFRERYGFSALAISRYGEVITERLRDMKLKFGDALLLQGPRDSLPSLQGGEDFLLLSPVEVETRRKKKAPLAAAIMILVIGLVVIGGLNIALAMVIGALTMVLTRTLDMEEAYESIDWRTVFLVAGMLPLGVAMEETGTARYLADQLIGPLADLGPTAALAGIYLLAALLTQPMSNAAAIVLVVPIAIDTAAGLGASHLTFTMATVIGAATSFLTPVGHKANVLVFGPGGYRFLDYTRVGAPLTLALFAVSMIFIPIFWPMFPA